MFQNVYKEEWGRKWWKVVLTHRIIGMKWINTWLQAAIMSPEHCPIQKRKWKTLKFPRFCSETATIWICGRFINDFFPLNERSLIFSQILSEVVTVLSCISLNADWWGVVSLLFRNLTWQHFPVVIGLIVCSCHDLTWLRTIINSKPTHSGWLKVWV